MRPLAWNLLFAALIAVGVAAVWRSAPNIGLDRGPVFLSLVGLAGVAWLGLRALKP